MKKALFAALATGVLMLGVVGMAQATAYTAYNVPANTVGDQNWTGSLGMDFNVNHDINILSLGAFDSGSNGFLGPITVQLYDRTTATVIEQVVLGPGNPGVANGGSSFLTLVTPITLHAGFEGSIVAFGYSSNDPNGNKGFGSFQDIWTTNNGGGLISFVGGARYNASNDTSFPTILDGGPADRYASGNFQFVPVPEPGTMVLFGAGFLGLAIYGKRRKNA